jgi:putative endonuclease
MLKTISGRQYKTYVGYSTNVSLRLKKHNSNTGAKSTKGHKWKIIFKKRFISKSLALSYEYYLKNNRNLRKKILSKYEKKIEKILLITNITN